MSRLSGYRQNSYVSQKKSQSSENFALDDREQGLNRDERLPKSTVPPQIQTPVEGNSEEKRGFSFSGLFRPKPKHTKPRSDSTQRSNETFVAHVPYQSSLDVMTTRHIDSDGYASGSESGNSTPMDGLPIASQFTRSSEEIQSTAFDRAILPDTPKDAQTGHSSINVNDDPSESVHEMERAPQRERSKPRRGRRPPPVSYLNQRTYAQRYKRLADIAKPDAELSFDEVSVSGEIEDQLEASRVNKHRVAHVEHVAHQVPTVRDSSPLSPAMANLNSSPKRRMVEVDADLEPELEAMPSKPPKQEAFEKAMQHERDPNVYGLDFEHRLFGSQDEDPIVVCNVLGHGTLGIVEEVRRRNTQLPTFVRKRVQLSARKQQAKATLRIIQEEARNLKSLVHPHIVTLIGSYEEMKQSNRHFYFLLMCPVGDNDLKNFLDIAGDQIEQDPLSTLSSTWRDWIWSWFPCLASALAYMHEKGIRHQDIKPSNIIHKGNRVYFTDFSSSCAFEVGHTTSTENPSRSSPMYAAPEITDRYTGSLARHGRASDIFALGCVFCDMLTVMKERTIFSFHQFLVDWPADREDTSYERGPLHYSRKIESISSWFSISRIFIDNVSFMLQSDRNQRPTAADVLQRLVINHVFDNDCECWKDISADESPSRKDHGAIDVPREYGSMLRITPRF
ncbi:kinase-like protein [Cucurbitaria berberidis CBS 394.84]|uniref:Kinase-like protein n=1 Tax=Cucurbitaria berberidis CBS 394.84 TaxID=1168544 RepID=A0A9P4GSM9_9PLEO|nr:kinase-like protein [Cucurbitaria berberidis CBS 394.84]KAF1851072.1 kinase-like protein [Cucurbitaria berberidis CBS 394.84]